MSTIAGRVFTGLTRAAFSRTVYKVTPTFGLNSVRLLALSSQTSAESKDGNNEVDNTPIKFSTSKGSHRTWKVERSMGSQFQRPLRKVIPIILIFTSFMLWVAFRSETDFDKQLEKELYERFPALLPDEEEEEAQNKSS
ncbi:ubiquinol-cytochrome c reductase complex assembly factor 4 isoform X2 [Sebastes fasciatus]|uniref:ubiquinol-cytochrome c reductase complex assembly factor 4 isoform X2 n=1 Tax=Sebastes fasciatus TaxID=394691 RepID=UPI003D9E7A03